MIDILPRQTAVAESLPLGWYEREIADGVDLAKPGIYEWIIEGAGRCIGKYTHSSRPLGEYERNVLKILNGLPYRLKSRWHFEECIEPLRTPTEMEGR